MPSARARLSRLVVLILALEGCATWSKHGVAARPPGKIRLVVLPVQVDVQVKHLRNVQTVETPESPPVDENERIALALRQAAEEITQEMEADLQASYFFEVVADSAVRRALETVRAVSSTAPLTASQIQDIGRFVDAQCVLATKLSGYGAVKKKWLFYLIGSGLVEGLVQGAVVAAAVSSPWVAVGVGTEEAAQETAEWGGGAYLFGRIWSPVVLEGSLVSVIDGGTVWSATALESSGGKALNGLPKNERRKREVRLRATARRAAASLARRLNDKAWMNLKKAAPPEPRFANAAVPAT